MSPVHSTVTQSVVESGEWWNGPRQKRREERGWERLESQERQTGTRNEWQSGTEVRPKSIRQRSTLPLKGGKMLLQIMESQKRCACHYKLSILQTEEWCSLLYKYSAAQPPELTRILGNVVTQVSSSGAWVTGVLSSPVGAVPGEMSIFSHLSKGHGACSCQAEAQDGSRARRTDAAGARGESSAWDLRNLRGCGNS